MSVSIRQNVFSPKLPDSKRSITYWSRLYGGAKPLAIASLSEQLNNPIMIILNIIMDCITIGTGKKNQINKQIKLEKVPGA